MSAFHFDEGCGSVGADAVGERSVALKGDVTWVEARVASCARVDAITPSLVPASGGVMVTLHGEGFVAGSATAGCEFGPSSAGITAAAYVHNSSTAVCAVPPHAAAGSASIRYADGAASCRSRDYGTQPHVEHANSFTSPVDGAGVSGVRLVKAQALVLSHDVVGATGGEIVTVHGRDFSSLRVRACAFTPAAADGYGSGHASGASGSPPGAPRAAVAPVHGAPAYGAHALAPAKVVSDAMMVCEAPRVASTAGQVMALGIELEGGAVLRTSLVLRFTASEGARDTAALLSVAPAFGDEGGGSVVDVAFAPTTRASMAPSVPALCGFGSVVTAALPHGSGYQCTAPAGPPGATPFRLGRRGMLSLYTCAAALQGSAASVGGGDDAACDASQRCCMHFTRVRALEVEEITSSVGLSQPAFASERPGTVAVSLHGSVDGLLHGGSARGRLFEGCASSSGTLGDAFACVLPMRAPGFAAVSVASVAGLTPADPQSGAKARASVFELDVRVPPEVLSVAPSSPQVGSLVALRGHHMLASGVGVGAPSGVACVFADSARVDSPQRTLVRTGAARMLSSVLATCEVPLALGGSGESFALSLASVSTSASGRSAASGDNSGAIAAITAHWGTLVSSHLRVAPRLHAEEPASTLSSRGNANSGLAEGGGVAALSVSAVRDATGGAPARARARLDGDAGRLLCRFGTVWVAAFETRNGVRADAGAATDSGDGPVAGSHTCIAPSATSAVTHTVPLAAARASDPVRTAVRVHAEGGAGTGYASYAYLADPYDDDLAVIARGGDPDLLVQPSEDAALAHAGAAMVSVHLPGGAFLSSLARLSATSGGAAAASGRYASQLDGRVPLSCAFGAAVASDAARLAAAGGSGVYDNATLACALPPRPHGFEAVRIAIAGRPTHVSFAYAYEPAPTVLGVLARSNFTLAHVRLQEGSAGSNATAGASSFKVVSVRSDLHNVTEYVVGANLQACSVGLQRSRELLSSVLVRSLAGESRC